MLSSMQKVSVNPIVWPAGSNNAGIETRATILGHIQRGGAPTAKDRVYASTMGAYAVDLLHRGATNRVIAYQNGKFTDFDINEALSMTKGIDEYQFLASRLMVMY